MFTKSKKKLSTNSGLLNYNILYIHIFHVNDNDIIVMLTALPINNI